MLKASQVRMNLEALSEASMSIAPALALGWLAITPTTTTTATPDGPEALDRLQAETPDLLVTDLDTPGLSGMDLLTTLQPLDGGRASVAGFDVTTQSQQVRGVIGLAGQSAAVDEMLTARENLRLFGWLYRLDRSTLSRRIDEVIEQEEPDVVAEVAEQREEVLVPVTGT